MKADGEVSASCRKQGDDVMGDLFQPTHLIVIAVVLLVLFGGKKLPELGKGLRRSEQARRNRPHRDAQAGRVGQVKIWWIAGADVTRGT